jgi:hypothetical protein
MTAQRDKIQRELDVREGKRRQLKAERFQRNKGVEAMVEEVETVEDLGDGDNAENAESQQVWTVSRFVHAIFVQVRLWFSY